jgi:gliding motility-associated protein GldL
MSSTNQISKPSGLNKFLETPGFRRFMAVAYGLGASLVILGALFKINHYQGANEMLLIGMITEAIIFALSALQKPHVEPDWSKVHPELFKDYHGFESDDLQVSTVKTTGGKANQIDVLLQKANIDEDVISRLGSGLTRLSETAAKMNDMARVSVANEEFLGNLKNASNSVASLSGTFSKASLSMEQELAVTSDFSTNVKEASKAASQLRQVFSETASTLKDDIEASQSLTKNMKSASESAGKLAESYFKSSESIIKNIENLQNSAQQNVQFNQQMKKLSDNLQSLNSIYELQLKSSEQQSVSAEKMQETMKKFLHDMESSAQQTTQYQKEMNILTAKMASLNNIYGNMLSAMNVK